MNHFPVLLQRMQPPQYDLWCSVAKDNSITHVAAAPSNLDAAITMRSAETELQITIELRATVSEIAPPKPDGSRRQSENYFTSNDPHHDIYTFSYWQIFWHSIWHIFWHSIWHSIWHFIWHIFWHFFWHSIWHIFWHSIWHIFWYSFWHIFWPFCLAYLLTFFLTFFLAFYLAYLLTFYLTSFFFPLRSGSAHCDLEVAVEVRQCPLQSGSRGWGPAVPTGIWSSRLRSGSAHWDLELAVEVRPVPTATWKSRLRSGSAHCDLQLAVEVRQCPLGSGARGGGPAVPTGIWTARRRRRRRRRQRRRRRRRRRTALIKSNNPHLAGGEKSGFWSTF